MACIHQSISFLLNSHHKLLAELVRQVGLVVLAVLAIMYNSMIEYNLLLNHQDKLDINHFMSL